MSVRVRDLSFSYKNNEVLHDVSFSAEKGELVSILGPNGTGKSTLFRCILGVLGGYGGSIEVCGREASKMNAAELAGKVAYIPQLHYPSFNYTAADMVLMGTGSQFSMLRTPKRAQVEDMENALERVGIAELKNRSFPSLSGGEQQLVLMARALVQKAQVWILDEPCASLDFGNQIKVQQQLKTLVQDNYTIIQSTHNPDQAFMFSDKVVALKGGRVTANGEPREVINDETVKELYGIDVSVSSLYDDSVRICVPKALIP